MFFFEIQILWHVGILAKIWQKKVMISLFMIHIMWFLSDMKDKKERNPAVWHFFLKRRKIFLQVENQVTILFLLENRVNPLYYPFCLGKQENYRKSLKLHNWKTCSFTECFCKSLLLLPSIILLFYTCFSLPTSLSSNHASMIVKLYSIWYFSNAFFCFVYDKITQFDCWKLKGIYMR